MKKKRQLSSIPSRRKKRAKANSADAFLISKEGETPAWPSLEQLRQRLRGVPRSQLQCPYQFDKAF